MRFGYRREVTLAVALATTVILAPATSAVAGGDLFHTIPREVPAVDYRTGDVMMAPPIPYGHYAKDYAGSIHGAAGMAKGSLHGLFNKAGGLGHLGGLGHGLGHGHGHDGACGDAGCGSAGHGGLFSGHKHGHGAPCGTAGCGGNGLGLHGLGSGKHGLFGLGHKGDGLSLCGGPGQAACASPQGAIFPTGQGPSAQSCNTCGGFGMLGGHSCGLCGGKGLLGGLGGSCHGCGGKGLLGGSPCGGCGGLGLLNKHGHGNACGSCGGHGKLHDGSPCGGCGGTGLLGHLKGKAHSLVGSLFHAGEIEYFVGPGGPVPLTPGYVPYVVPTRSPRDFFAFPPFSDRAMP